MLGPGIYLSRSFEKASRYPLNPAAGEQLAVLKLSVRVGKVKKIDYQGHPLQKTWHDHGYDTAWVPPNCGMVPSGLEEDCVYEPWRITECLDIDVATSRTLSSPSPIQSQLWLVLVEGLWAMPSRRGAAVFSMEEGGEEASSRSPGFRSAAEVECDACDGRKRKAEQSCLECAASYCGNHLVLHNILHGGKRHKLVEATERLQERTCPEHGRLLEVFCRTDQRCICHLCIIEAHRSHDVISIEVEVAEKKAQLEKMQTKTTQRIQTRETEEQELRQAVEAFKVSAEDAVAENEKLFAELVRSLEDRQCTVRDLILAQKEAVIKEVGELTGKVQQRIRELKERHADLQQLEQLLQEHNHIQFLELEHPHTVPADGAVGVEVEGHQVFWTCDDKPLISVLTTVPPHTDSLGVSTKTKAGLRACSISPLPKAIQTPVPLVPPYRSFELTTEAISELLKKLNLICQWSFITISERGKATSRIRHAATLTLDSDTVNNNIHLSADHMLLTAVRESESYPYHPQRFRKRVQALCEEGLRGSPRYWEVKCGSKGTWVSIAISYKGIRRSGRQAPLFGRCQNSWALRKYGSLYEFWHNDKGTDISGWFYGSTVGVYLDHGAGVLAFYNVSDNISLIHKVQTSPEHSSQIQIIQENSRKTLVNKHSVWRSSGTPPGHGGSVSRQRERSSEESEISLHMQVPSRRGAAVFSMEEGGEEASSRSPGFRSAAEVECDACDGRKRKAEQSCLECAASYCGNHLVLHNILHGGKRHKLVEATERLQERTCPEHGRLLEVFCRTDQRCICHLCIIEAHRSHDVISIEVEVAEAHMRLGALKMVITDRINTRQREVQELERAVEAFKISAEKTLEDHEKLLTEMIHSMETRKSRAKELIRAQEEAVLTKANEVLDRMEEELGQLRRRDAELQYVEQLSQGDDDIRFLQGVSSVPALPPSRDAVVFFVHPYCSFEPSAQAVSKLTTQLSLICRSSFTGVSEEVKKAGILSAPARQSREDFLQYASKLTLNLNTAHWTLRLSKENREVTAMPRMEAYVDHPDRFDFRAQILCNEGLQGSPRYWEVEYSGGSWACIAVSYLGIQRKGKRGPLFGRNRYSWALRCYVSSYSFWHNNQSSSVPYSRRCSRMGVYLDHGAGVLAFYNVSDNMSLIHRVRTKFTEPVYAGFGLAGKGTRIKLCNLNEDVLTGKETLLFGSEAEGHLRTSDREAYSTSGSTSLNQDQRVEAAVDTGSPNLVLRQHGQRESTDPTCLASPVQAGGGGVVVWGMLCPFMPTTDRLLMGSLYWE
ncbi:hypothetical protein NFI96_023725 [Prochilodus magdalenae]|nr:hypothetical protein NFI96_023725 [Prochilodus magdalenae]